MIQVEQTALNRALECAACFTGSPGHVSLAPVTPAILPPKSECSVVEYTLTTQINAWSECNSVCFQQNLSHNIRQIKAGNQQSKE